MRASWFMLGITGTALMASGRLAAQSVDGQMVYKEECKSCHGINGVPPERAQRQYKKIRALGDSGFVSTLSQDSIMTLLKKGIDKDMKSFAEKLSPEEMNAVAGYIKELAGKRQGS